ncbi:MAG: hypothetical protein JJE07_05700, partial [Flavobacteriaceae bacterium]|nr:hypothetical protein [Flavobacteriaceae bacterium]
FQLLWRYFSWANQSIAAIALWVGTVYLYQRKTLYIIALVPAFFITSVLGSYLFYDPTIGFGLDIVTSDIIGIVISVLITILFFIVMKKNKELPESDDDFIESGKVAPKHKDVLVEENSDAL